MEQVSPGCLPPAVIEALVTARLTTTARLEAEEHLAGCERCREQVAMQQQFEECRLGYAALAVLPEPPNLPGYVVERELGSGGCGTVWLARDGELPRPRALKVLRSGRFSARALQALREEGRTLDSLGKHPHRLLAHRLVDHAGGLVLVMEYIDGGPLSDQAPLPWERAARYVAHAAEGLKDVHAAGLVHGDIKPANLLWDRERDAAVLADFGLAVKADEPLRGYTLAFAAAEVLEGWPATPASDVFALAATLFALITGFPPFWGRDRQEQVDRMRAGLPDDVPEVKSLPRPLQELLRESLHVEFRRRPGLAEFHARLKSLRMQELAERLGVLAGQCDCKVRLDVLLAVSPGPEHPFRTLLTTSNKDRTLFGGPPRREVRVKTGELLQIQARADADGYVTILNFGSGGDLAVVLPNPSAKDHRLTVKGRQGAIVKMTPPAGVDRLAVIWTRSPSVATAEDWQARLSGEGSRKLRGMEFVQPLTGDWTAVVVTVIQEP